MGFLKLFGNHFQYNEVNEYWGCQGSNKTKTSYKCLLYIRRCFVWVTNSITFYTLNFKKLLKSKSTSVRIVIFHQMDQ